MGMLKFAICDDKPFMADELSACLSAYMSEQGTDYSLRCFADGRALLDSGADFDLIFLDIQMAQPDGMETARLLRKQGNGSLLVFVTVLQEYVFDAFEVGAHDYLLKPLQPDRFRRTMERALSALHRRAAGSVVIQRGAACEIIPLAQLVYCEVQGRKIYLHRQDGTTVDFYGRLETLARRMDGRFFRCHRSYLVNLDEVRGCAAGRVTLSQGGEIPVSRLREREFMQALLCHMKQRGL